MHPFLAGGCDAQNATRAAVEWGPVLLAATYSADPTCANSTTAGQGTAVTIRGKLLQMSLACISCL